MSSTCCGFTPEGVFDPDNWNCPTINRIRNIVYEGYGWEHLEIHEVSYQYCDDDKFATINLSYMWDEEREGCAFPMHDCLWVGWYKNRGKTNAMWLVGSYDELEGLPRRPTRDELIRIADYFEDKYPVVKG